MNRRGLLPNRTSVESSFVSTPTNSSPLTTPTFSFPFVKEPVCPPENTPLESELWQSGVTSPFLWSVTTIDDLRSIPTPTSPPSHGST